MSVDTDEAQHSPLEPEGAAHEGSVAYLDGSGLARPFDLPKSAYRFVAVLLVAAAVIGALMLSRYFDATVGAPARAQQQVQDNIARKVDYDLPTLSALMASDDEAIKQSLSDAGFTLYETTKEGQYPDGGFDLVKLPADVSLAEAGVMYASGISSLSAVDASKLLKGSWTLSVNRTGTTDMRLRYADFASGSVDAAIKAAMQAEGLAEAKIAESGTDDAGNTYESGTVDANGATYSWRVSAISLSSAYKIDGLPDTAVYVGIRMTK